MSTSLVNLLVWVLFASSWLAVTNYAQADVFNSGKFRLTSTEHDGIVQLTARLPTGLVPYSQPGKTAIYWPDNCTQLSFNRHEAGAEHVLVYHAKCILPFQQGAKIDTPWVVDAAVLYSSLDETSQQTTLRNRFTTLSIPIGRLEANGSNGSNGLAIATEYLYQGVLHILFGWDHIAFVLCLFFLARGRQLLWLISGFSLGHSLTLGLAFFSVVKLPIQPVELLIALSIVLMAREAMLAKKQAASGTLRLTVVASLFGLVHGLGFASALSELGVDNNRIWESLLFFNLGVEAGQILFIFCLLAISELRLALLPQNRVKKLTLYLTGALGVFWTIERLLTF